MDTFRTEDVTLFPYRNKIESVLTTTFDASGDGDTFSISMGGDYLPDGTDGYIDDAWFGFDLDLREAKELYDELGRWIKEQDGSS